MIMSYIPELAVYSEESFFKRAQPFLFEVKSGNFLELTRILGFENVMRLQFFSLKNRDFFLQRRFLKGLAKRKDVRDFIRSIDDENGYYKLYGDVVYSGYEPPSLYRYFWGFSPFFEKYLRLMLELARNNDILVLFPMFTAPVDGYENFYLPNYIPQIYAAHLNKISKDFPNLVFWNWQNDFSERHIYRDGVHLNRAGCVRLSQKLGEILVKIRLAGEKYSFQK